MLGNNEPPPAVLLGQMPHQQEVRAPEDDWTGLADAAERRKLQNRLNQRIYRKCSHHISRIMLQYSTVRCCRLTQARHFIGRRRRAKPSGQGSESTTDCVTALKPQDSGYARGSTKANGPLADSPATYQPSGNAHRQADRPGPVVKPVTSIHNLSPAGIQEMMIQYEKLAHRDYLLGSPRVDQLLTLIQFNVFRALVSNTCTLGFTMEWLEEDALSPWSSRSFGRNDASCPTSLRPTMLQRKIPHHPWIDLFPIPRMRDNLLLAGDSYDETALCNDLIDFCDVPNEKTGLIVWGEPWNPSGWEVSEAFLTKWGWVLNGCHELVESTNYWRVTRADTVLFFET